MPDDLQIKISLTPNAGAILRSFQTMPDWMAQAILRVIDREDQYTVAHIQKDYLSFPRTGPTVPIGCRVITNRLRSSIRASTPRIVNGGIAATIGSNVIYAAAQEFGVDEMVTVSPHTRKNVREENVFGKRRLVRKADIGVRAFQRHMKLPGRGFVQRGIKDRLPAYRTSISKAIVDGWNKNATQ